MGQKVDWYYRRKGLTTCAKAQGYLERRGVQAGEEIDAGKARLGREAALALAGQVTRIIAAKGGKVLVFDMKKRPPAEAELLGALLGPTGNLRAPVIRRGSTLLVGFQEKAYDEVLA